MNTKQVIENMVKEFDGLFVRDNGPNVEDSFTDPNGSVGPVRKFIRDYTRTLLESFGEEIIPTEFKLKGRDEEYIRGFNDGHKYAVGEQRLKVKEILEVIK